MDAVIVVGGLTPEWESEGFDRPSLQLPGRQDELIQKVARANPRTIVCVQAVRDHVLSCKIKLNFVPLGFCDFNALDQRDWEPAPDLVPWK